MSAINPHALLLVGASTMLNGGSNGSRAGIALQCSAADHVAARRPICCRTSAGAAAVVPSPAVQRAPLARYPIARYPIPMRRAAFIPFLVACDPDAGTTVEALKKLDEVRGWGPVPVCWCGSEC